MYIKTDIQKLNAASEWAASVKNQITGTARRRGVSVGVILRERDQLAQQQINERTPRIIAALRERVLHYLGNNATADEMAAMLRGMNTTQAERDAVILSIQGGAQ